MATQWITINVDGENVWAYMTIPESQGPHPGVVVIHHGYLDDWVQDISRRLMSAGYATISPDLNHREDPEWAWSDAGGRMGRLRDENIIVDVNAAIEHLRRHPSVRGDRIGITGFCLGGRITYMMAGTNPILKAAGVFYGGNTMVSWGGVGPPPFARTPNIQCPVISFFGGDDPNPSPDDMTKIDAELTRYGKVHEFHSYPGASHSFQWNGTDAYRAEASRDSWAKLLDWFQKYLKE